jgi:molybdenum cofactor cytidylyltransferase
MFDCVIPAAGASSRMRSPQSGLGDGILAFKPLLPFGNSTLVETAVRSGLGAGSRVLLVVGYMGDEVEALFAASAYAAYREKGKLVVLRNSSWEEGLTGSIQAALPALGGEAFFISHADMPFVSSDAYRTLAAAWAARSASASPEAAVFAAHDSALGHPVLVPSSWIPEILALRRADRLRNFLADRPRELAETGSGALADIDTPEEYEAALKACAAAGSA